MKLTNLALLGAIFGPNATSATDAITGINDPLKRELSSSEASSSSSTKSSKKSKGASYNIDYSNVAGVILASLGCSECGNSCHTMNDEAVDALEAIAAGESLEEAWLTTADYQFGVCNNRLECISRDPFVEGDFTVTYAEVVSTFSGAQDTCEDDSVLRPLNELLSLHVMTAAVSSAVVTLTGNTEKNVKNIMLKNILDACGGALGFWSVGYAFAYGGEMYRDQLTFAATAATIVAGTVAERCKVAAYLCYSDSGKVHLDYSIFLQAFVYPIVVKSIEDDLFRDELTARLGGLLMDTAEYGLN